MHRMFLVVLDWFVCMLSVLHITVSLLRLYFDLCLFICLFTLIVVFVIYCFVLPIVANKDLHKYSRTNTYRDSHMIVTTLHTPDNCIHTSISRAIFVY